MPKGIKGGRRTSQEKETSKCQGAVDFFTQDLIDEEFYAIRIKEGAFYYCFDVRSLLKWFETGKRTNPLTGLNFSPENIAKIAKKITKVGLEFNDNTNNKLTKEDLEMLDRIMEIRHFNIRVLKPNYENIDVETINYQLTAYVGDSKYDMLFTFGNSEIIIFTLNANIFNGIVNQLTEHVGRSPEILDPAFTGWEF
jgi:hypothetical protein